MWLGCLFALAYPVSWWLLVMSTKGEEPFVQTLAATIVLTVVHIAFLYDRKQNRPTERQMCLLKWTDFIKECQQLPWWTNVQHVWLHHQHELTNEQKYRLYSVLRIELHYRFDEPAVETMNVWRDINEQLLGERTAQEREIDEALTLIEADQSWETMKRTLK